MVSEFVQGILVGVVLALGAGALALYLGRVSGGTPGGADATSRTTDSTPATPVRQSPHERR